MSAELEQVTTAIVEIDRVAAGMALLRKNYENVIFDPTTKIGMEMAKAARTAIREPRYSVERIRKAAKAPLLALGKKLDAEAARITGELLKLETPIHEVIAEEEGRIEQERLAKIAANEKRIAELHERVAELRGNPSLSSNDSPDNILDHILDLEALVVDDSFQELKQQAEDAKSGGLARLRAIHAAAVERVAEQARIKAEREELARLRAEAAAREASEKAAREAEEKRRAEARARQEVEAKAQRDAEAAKLKAEREENERIAAERRAELDRQEAEAKTAREAEEARLEAERQANAEEAARIVAQREAFEREERRRTEEWQVAAQAEALRKSQVHEVQTRQESAHSPFAPLQAVPDLKETTQDQGTSLIADNEPTVEVQALEDSSEISGVMLAVLLSRARYYVWNYESENDEEETDRSELIDAIDEALGVEEPSPVTPTVTNGRPEDWDDDSALPF